MNRRSKAKDEDHVPCLATMASEKMLNHTHSCLGDHEEGGIHFCGECKSWWGKRPFRGIMEDSNE